MFMKRNPRKNPDAFDKLTPYNEHYEKMLKTIGEERSKTNSIDIENKGFFGEISRTVLIKDQAILNTLNNMKQTGSEKLVDSEINHLIRACEKNPILLPEFTEELIKYLKFIANYHHEIEKPTPIPSIS